MPQTKPLRYGLGLWSNYVQTSFLLAETQTVMTIRMLGMLGIVPAPRGENARMLEEKASAFTASAMAAGIAVMGMQPPDRVYNAAIRPIRKKTRSNAKRLTRP
ncbi:MAG: antifreeze protein [Pseudomonadota bacterium]